MGLKLQCALTTMENRVCVADWRTPVCGERAFVADWRPCSCGGVCVAD